MAKILLSFFDFSGNWSKPNELIIEIGGSKSLDKNGKPTIITKEQFLDFMGQNVASFESKVLEALA